MPREHESNGRGNPSNLRPTVCLHATVAPRLLFAWCYQLSVLLSTRLDPAWAARLVYYQSDPEHYEFVLFLFPRTALQYLYFDPRPLTSTWYCRVYVRRSVSDRNSAPVYLCKISRDV